MIIWKLSHFRNSSHSKQVIINHVQGHQVKDKVNLALLLLQHDALRLGVWPIKPMQEHIPGKLLTIKDLFKKLPRWKLSRVVKPRLWVQQTAVKCSLSDKSFFLFLKGGILGLYFTGLSYWYNITPPSTIWQYGSKTISWSLSPLR